MLIKYDFENKKKNSKFSPFIASANILVYFLTHIFF